MLILLVCSCASAPLNNNVLVLVDDDAITKEDLEYSLRVAHRREDLSSAQSLDVSEYVDKLINEKLIVQEALRMGLESSPAVQKKVDAYILRESVVLLYRDEMTRKVTVTDQEILEEYKKDYERFTLNIIETASESKAADMLEQIKKGADFLETARGQSTFRSNNEDGKVMYIRKRMNDVIGAIVIALQPGEISDVFESGGKYYILKLLNKEAAPDEEFSQYRERIENAIRKEREKQRSSEYVKQLRVTYNVKIERETLDSIDANVEKEEREKLLADERMLVEYDGGSLTVGGFAELLSPNFTKSKEDYLDTLIDRKIVDIEALSRNYPLKDPLKGKLHSYQNQLLRKAFINEAVLKNLAISEKDIEDYFLDHKEEFVKPFYYKNQQITLNTKKEAEDILESLRNGADFSWVAKNKSLDGSAKKGGHMEWKRKGNLPGPVGAIMDDLKPGELSPVLKVDNLFKIIRLTKKTEKEYEKIEAVKKIIHKKIFHEKYDKLYGEYVDQLKEDAQIRMNDEEIKSFKKIFGK